MMAENKQGNDLEYVTGKLLPEFTEKFRAWNTEYSDIERDLGVIGTFTDFWRKAKKIKSAIWDGTDSSGWREDIRTVLFELIANAFLMLCDLDREEDTTGQDVEPQSEAWICTNACRSLHRYGTFHTREEGCGFRDTGLWVPKPDCRIIHNPYDSDWREGVAYDGEIHQHWEEFSRG